MSALFKLRGRYNKKMLASMVSVKFINLDSIVDVEDPPKIIKQYTDLLNEINKSISLIGGHLGEQIGNFIMFFLLEEEEKEHSEKACNAAIIIREHINKVNMLKAKEGIQPYKVAIGVHTGEVIVSDEMKLLGENVNVTNKILEECEPEKNEILVSETTIKMVGGRIHGTKSKQLYINLPKLFHNTNQLSLYSIL